MGQVAHHAGSAAGYSTRPDVFGICAGSRRGHHRRLRGFSAICGSTSATAATMASVALPEMKKYNYDPALATGVVAAGGSLGILIPPARSSSFTAS